MADFDRFDIEVRQNTEDWGPFRFDFTEALPDGVSIVAVDLRSYLGNVKPKEQLSGETETTSEVVDAIKTVVLNSTTISAYFNYPTTAAYRGRVRHTLVFNLTFDNGATHSFYGYFVRCY